MVQLKNPTPAILMNLECTAWARNIHHNRQVIISSLYKTKAMRILYSVVY
jgi:hypothetical protein